MSDLLDASMRTSDAGLGFFMQDWAQFPAEIHRTGSRYICNPPVFGTDEDFIVLMRGDPAARLLDIGFKQDGSPQFYTGNDNGGFRSYRRGSENLIVTSEQEFFDKFVCATELAKRFNLKSKPDRIALFQAVLYGVEAFNLEQEA
jgi:hypothetical protein